MKKSSNSRERIIEAAVEEFSENGYYGARVDSIAEKARINKAMIFYYFSSKDELYKKVLRFIASQIVENLVSDGMAKEEITPSQYVERFPRVYMKFFRKNPEYLRIIGLGLIQNSELMKTIIVDMFSEINGGLPEKFSMYIEKWSEEGKITESDPAHFFMNLVSLSLFPLLSRPISEAIFGKDFNDSTFVDERLKSINTLLKKGMIK